MDDLLKSLLGRMGVRLPGIGGVPDLQPVDPHTQTARDQEALDQQAKKLPPKIQSQADGAWKAMDDLLFAQKNKQKAYDDAVMPF